MKSLFSTIMNNSLFNFAKRLAIVCVFLSISAAAAASSTWDARYYVENVKILPGSTGSGLVYIDPQTEAWAGTESNNNYGDYKGIERVKEGELPTTKNGGKLTFNVTHTGVSNDQNTYAFNNLYLKVNMSNYLGSTFEGWYEDDGNGGYKFVDAEKYALSSTVNKSPGYYHEEKNIYAMFTAKTYYANTPIIRAVVAKEGGGYELCEDSYVYFSAQSSAPGDDSDLWVNELNSTKIYAQGNGIDDSYSFNYYLYAKPGGSYKLDGWYELDGNGGTPQILGEMKEITYQISSTCSDESKVPANTKVIIALFSPSETYWYYGPSVAVAGDADTRAERGLVYAATTNTPPTENNQWATEINSTDKYSKENDPEFTFYYFAQAKEGYAFKGWALNQYDEPTVFGNEYPHKAEDANITEDNPYSTPILYAVFEALFYKAPPAEFANLSDGLGQIAVSLTATDNPSYSSVPVAAGNLQQVPNDNGSHKYTVHYYATPNSGSRFVGWSSTADGLNLVSQDAHYEKEYTTLVKDKDAPHVAAPLYAVFRSDIDIRQQDRMIVYIDDEGNGNINDAKVLIDFQKADILTAKLSGNDASLFTLSNRSGSKTGSTINFDATQGLIEMLVIYKGNLNEAVGKKAEITLSANYNSETVSRAITITVEEAPVITFLPTDGKGEYAINMTNGSGVNYAIKTTTQEDIKVPITHESMSNLELSLISDVTTDNYYFFGWQIIDGDKVSYISYEDVCTYQFTKSVKVKAEFIPKNRATYFIKNDPTNTPYHDFQLAMDAAENLASSTGNAQVVVLNPYPIGKENGKELRRILPKGNYTIPNKVHLLIPGEDTYKITENIAVSDCVNSTTFAEYVRWIMEDGTTITIEGGGEICVYATISNNGASSTNGRPSAFGHIQMGENCHFDFQSSSKLFAFGYITGPLTSSVTMQSGTTIKETFQIYDFRGGTATSMGLNTCKDKKVFIVGQYYVQNVEVPLTLMPGATEILAASLYVNDNHTCMEATFVGTDKGFFQLGDGTSLTKYYNPYEDRLVFEAAQAKDNPTKIGKLGNVGLVVSGMTIDSKDFVLPVPNNYDIVLKDNAQIQVLYDAALMPGATLTINKGCTLSMNKGSNFYAYDAVYRNVNGTGYYGSIDAEGFAITNRPGDASDNVLYKRFNSNRKIIDPQDAKVVIDGLLDCSDGYFYTTNTSTSAVDHANITSNGGGKIKFGALGSKTETYQVKQVGETNWLGMGTVKAMSLPVAQARMRNTTAPEYTAPSANTTYTYINGTWSTSTTTLGPTIPDPVDYIPKFTIAETVTMDAYVGESATITLSPTPNNNAVDWTGKVTWKFECTGENADRFILFGSNSSRTITFTPTSEGTKTASVRITATYSHIVNNQTVKYTYSKDVFLIGNALYHDANTLAFADLSVLYKGQDPIALFAENSKNNANNITISADPTYVTISGSDNNATIRAGNVGEVTITASQEADETNNVAATTITKKVNVTERVVWNWDILYFGTVNETPVSVLDGSTNWELVESKDTSNIIAYDKANLKATIADQIAGKYGAEFTFKQAGYADIVFKSVVIANPQHLRVDVNNDTVFRAVTLSANDNVSFYTNQTNADNNCVRFKSSASSISQWKMTFIGVPDKVHFVPVGKGSWQIEESYNNINWTTSFPWKTIAANSDFEMSLLPSTRYLRISYGASLDNEKPDPALKDFYITELAHVKADVQEVFMPFMVNEGNTQTAILAPKEIVLTYANTSILSVTTSNTTLFKVKKSLDSGEAGETFTIPATTEANPFGITGIEVVSHATSEEQGYVYVYEGSNLVLQIPITTYAFPQELPIKLATDKPDGGDRYYYVTTRTHNAEWDGTDGVRTITLNNAVSDADPYVTFAFRGNPTYISFDHTAIKGAFEIEQSVNGLDWVAVPHNASNDIMDGQHIKRTVAPESNYLRILYKSPYAEIINITNVIIVGDASIVIEPSLLELYDDKQDHFTASVVNLAGMTITVTKGNFEVCATEAGTYTTTPLTLTSTQNSLLDGKQMGNIPIYVKWNNKSDVAIEYGMLEVTNPYKNNELMGTVELIGIKGDITSGDMGIYTGVHNGEDGVVVENAAKYTLNGSFEDEAKEYRKVNIDAAIATDGTPLFDYVVIYGETTTNDGTTTITTPTTMVGSNAKTPCYIYKKNAEGTAYTLARRIENTNAKEKTLLVEGEDAFDVGTSEKKVYITGFCPYASTGYTKADEGVWYFRGEAGGHIHVYLEDCYIYSRSKTDEGHSFADRSDGYSFVEPYVRGSGAVLVFACKTQTNIDNHMNVTIHTLDRNLLKSHYGCFLQSVAGRAYQASSPVQVRLIDNSYLRGSAVTLNFTDEWESSKNTLTGKRTNGFLSLQKQVNNAPSIDMGNGNTIVNFNGGQVELQNAQIVSPNYKSSLAICPRAGTFAGILLAYGMGTDDVAGTVNFNDGTTTVLPMYVSPDYAESYLLDKDAEGNPIKKDGKYLTTCLRTPKNTFVHGGSHCMMRACSDPESQGGAPKDKEGNLLGLYKYPQNPEEEHKGGWVLTENGNGLVTPTENNIPDGYNVESVTPNPGDDGQIDEIPCSTGCDDYLNFWFDPKFENAVAPEIDKQISFWKTCMTLIEAEYAGYGGSVGGNTAIEMSGDLQTELVKYLLYCKIDDNILEVIGGADYQAPVMNPAPEGDSYLPIHPSAVGTEVEHYITNEKPFQVEDQLYYITTATADVWNAFTAPFDVANIYIMETYPENELQKLEANGKTRSEILKEQAKHNADFASFFGVTIALKQNKTFDRIYREYMSWANAQDEALGLKTQGGYTPRGMQQLVPFDGSNWATADFYLNENNGDWTYTGTVGKEFETQWIFPDASDGVLLEKGKTYSMLLPFCTKCADNGKETIEERTFWDYWSGKFLIFESTDGPHEVNGKNYVDDIMLNVTPADNSAILMGNSSFAEVEPDPEKVYYYEGDLMHSTFTYDQWGLSVNPTESFVMMNVATPSDIRVRGLTTSGQIIYDKSNTNTDVNQGGIPTVGGGNDLFITSTEDGINIAVAEPQQVRVVSSTGWVIFSGMVSQSVDVPLSTTGIYIVSGENEVHKIVY